MAKVGARATLNLHQDEFRLNQRVFAWKVARRAEVFEIDTRLLPPLPPSAFLVFLYFSLAM